VSDSVAVPGDALDACVELAAVVFQGVDEFRRRAGDVNGAGALQEREDVLDDGGGDAGVDEAADLGYPLDGLRVVVPVAVG
jgi:hypothetical protein